MNKRFWIILGILVAGFGAFALWTGADRPAASTTQGTILVHRIGNPAAAVRLVEYSDFQCPACLAYYPVVEQVLEKYRDRISFEYRHYPLSTVHRNAFAAARASEAAGRQGKFWEMYHVLFGNQAVWADSDRAQSGFEGYARQLGLDAVRFKTDFASSQTNSAINASIAEFNSRGLRRATPTFLLNDERIEPGNTLEDFSELIDNQLARTSKQ